MLGIGLRSQADSKPRPMRIQLTILDRPDLREAILGLFDLAEIRLRLRSDLALGPQEPERRHH